VQSFSPLSITEDLSHRQTKLVCSIQFSQADSRVKV